MKTKKIKNWLFSATMIASLAFLTEGCDKKDLLTQLTSSVNEETLNDKADATPSAKCFDYFYETNVNLNRNNNPYFHLGKHHNAGVKFLFANTSTAHKNGVIQNQNFPSIGKLSFTEYLTQINLYITKANVASTLTDSERGKIDNEVRKAHKLLDNNTPIEKLLHNEGLDSSEALTITIFVQEIIDTIYAQDFCDYESTEEAILACVNAIDYIESTIESVQYNSSLTVLNKKNPSFDFVTASKYIACATAKNSLALWMKNLVYDNSFTAQNCENPHFKGVISYLGRSADFKKEAEEPKTCGEHVKEIVKDDVIGAVAGAAAGYAVGKFIPTKAAACVAAGAISGGVGNSLKTALEKAWDWISSWW